MPIVFFYLQGYWEMGILLGILYTDFKFKLSLAEATYSRKIIISFYNNILMIFFLPTAFG